MYLCKLNIVTGLIDLELDQDGFYAIPEFRNLLKKKNGLQQLTVVALVVDYLSPIRNYHEKEKPLKAQDIVFQNRKSMQWNSDEVQEAAIAYMALQHDLDLEEKKMLDSLRFDKQIDVKNAEDTTSKLRALDELERIKTKINNFNKQNEHKDLFSTSPVRNGYTLSRLEQKLENKKSFYYVTKEKPEANS